MNRTVIFRFLIVSPYWSASRFCNRILNCDIESRNCCRRAASGQQSGYFEELGSDRSLAVLYYWSTFRKHIGTHIYDECILDINLHSPRPHKLLPYMWLCVAWEGVLRVVCIGIVRTISTSSYMLVFFALQLSQSFIISVILQQSNRLTASVFGATADITIRFMNYFFTLHCFQSLKVL